MSNPHAPREDFVERLEAKIGREARQRNAAAASADWWPRLHPRALAGAAVLVIISMAIGGAVVAAAYQAQGNERRDLLLASYESRVNIAQQRLALAQEQLRLAEQQAAVGIGTQDAVQDARFHIVEGQAGVQSVRLQLEEIRMSGREPLNEVSSPQVSGRDFVTERWRVELTVPAAALDLERTRASALQRRFEIGMANRADLDVSRARIIELQAGLTTFQRKLDIRQRFLRGEFDAGMADLRLIEAETEQRLQAIAPKLDVARQALAHVEQRISMGLAPSTQRTEAQLRVQEIQLELTKLQVDLAAVRKQIDQRRGK